MIKPIPLYLVIYKQSNLAIYKSLVATYKPSFLVEPDDVTLYETILNALAMVVDIVNNPQFKVGHGYVIKMLLQGDIEVIDGVVIDHVGVLR